ncbi:hypothetical protein AC629_01180 [Bradyrhizobium sp. NAS80.1]|uniref:hypothetical protein n=1 Tax=Bradyrhizobium sp. NAS80.1 TaxID=1680159 RepID=UPI00095EA782|nr:hypothetical protein [Bradyrhizobium sp. NAS80.1]OKO92174.1 hypothetical protein AC629_01180 [Bradyrhizobium sp. NAS80.1]
MATLSELVAAIAAVEGVDAERVTAIARAVREDGLIQTSGRGTSAAQMSETDAANLLIAANTADTARTAPAAVKKYRTLQAKRRSSQFGNELEELISAAKRECLADHLTKMVALFGTPDHRFGKSTYTKMEYGFEIEFEKPVPSVRVHIWVSIDRQGDRFEFTDRRLPTTKTTGDRRERTTITQRTILAVANVLRT